VDDLARIVSGKGTIRVVLVFENPHAHHDVCTRRLGNEPPGVVVEKGLELLNHGRAPIWVG
jgi:hypothetical protein